MCAPVTDTPQTATDAPARGALHDKISLHAKYVTPVLFTLAILMSAGLLFFVQPLLTRMVTPMIGGAAGVWTTATLFFQCVMIGGYLYAHLLTQTAQDQASDWPAPLTLVGCHDIPTDGGCR